MGIIEDMTVFPRIILQSSLWRCRRKLVEHFRIRRFIRLLQIALAVPTVAGVLVISEGMVHR